MQLDNWTFCHSTPLVQMEGGYTLGREYMDLGKRVCEAIIRAHGTNEELDRIHPLQIEL